LLEGYRYHRHPKARARKCDDHELAVALAVTVQRLKPVLLRGGDVHAGGLDGGFSRGHCQSPEPRARLWLHDGVGVGDEEDEDEDEEGFYWDGGVHAFSDAMWCEASKRARAVKCMMANFLHSEAWLIRSAFACTEKKEPAAFISLLFLFSFFPLLGRLFPFWWHFNVTLGMLMNELGWGGHWLGLLMVFD
jgi:hypothetical protein